MKVSITYSEEKHTMYYADWSNISTDSSTSQKYVSLDDSDDDYSSEFVNGQTEVKDAPNNNVSYF